MESIITALITGAITLTGVLIANGLEADGKCGPMTWAKLLGL